MTATWTEPKYPGDAVRTAMLIRGDEIGDVRIQDYGASLRIRYKVGTFLPGETECAPGDTPKTWPERSSWAGSKAEANVVFDAFLRDSRAAGWKDYNRETGKAA